MNRTNRQGLDEAKLSGTDWCNLLSISHRYECKRARERSIKEINKLGPPVDNAGKIAMAKRFGVDQWLLPSCVALVERQDPLSYPEAEKLGLHMTVLLCEVREKNIQQKQTQMYSTGFGSYSPPNANKAKITQLVKEALNIQ